MMEARWERRVTNVFVAIVLAVFTLAGPASATPKGDDGEHKVTICHVTNSAKNPYVVITIDEAAWDGEGASDHTHHVSKDGRVDFVLHEGETCEGGPTDDEDDIDSSG
ncbi:MAG: hypothetical protein HKN91_01795 [Acidimicrobiia bacterium]|nr:hypothetical protein [Acidimicrobiia bacterium]